MTWFFSAMTGKSPWQTVETELKAQYVEQHKPEFITILDCNAKWSKDEAPPEHLAYRGPFYLDWDGAGDIDSVLADVRKFMDLLKSHNFDLRQASWWLSGRKGVHCTIPMACFYAEKTDQGNDSLGIPDLPDVYRKLAWEFITPSLDMRVYTARRGRMWRTTYRPRSLDDGKITWKVPIHPESLYKLDEAGYWDWCSQQRPEIRAEDPTINLQLKTRFSIALSELRHQKIERSKNKKQSMTFNNLDEVPTIQALFNGDAATESCNLNDLKLQMATAAVAVGFTSLDQEDAYIQAIQGFIEKRSQLKGVTHKTKIDIENAMREAFRYVAENSYFIYTPTGLRSILNDEYKSNSDYFGIDPADQASRTKFINQMAGNMQASNLGVVQLTSRDVEPVSDYVWKPGSLSVIRDEQGLVTHYSVIPVVSGEQKPRMLISLQDLNSQPKFSIHIQKLGGSIQGLNTKDSSKFRHALKNFVGASENTDTATEMVSTALEGVYIDIAQQDGRETEAHVSKRINRYWVECNTTYEGRQAEIVGHRQPFYIEPANPAGIFKTDLFNIEPRLGRLQPKLVESTEHLLNLNGNTYSLSVVLGWFTACFIKHILYKLDLIKNFPLMQVVGQAGSGKTTTINLLLNLFSYKNKINVLAANNTTRFALEKRLLSSASIPVVVDEVKAQNVSTTWMQDFRGLLQVAYSIGSNVSKGGGASVGSHYAEINNQPLLAPIAWLGESIETSQTSLLERLVPAMFHLSDKIGRAEHVKYLSRNEECISAIGFLIGQNALNCDLDYLSKLYLNIEKEVTDLLYNGSNDRIVANAVMVTTGFDFFRDTITQKIGTSFREKLQSMRDALLNKAFWTTEVAAEVDIFLRSMANASKEQSTSNRPICNEHYRFVPGESAEGKVNHLRVSAHRLFFIYRQRCKVTGVPAVYSAESELFSVLKNSAYAIDSGTDTILGADCVTFDIKKMTDAGIPEFSNK